MSVSRKDNVKHEIISAMSSLNMAPELIEDPEGPYLSDRDKWAAHCLEHLNQALRNLDSMETSHREDIENSYHEGLVRGSYLEIPLPYDDIVGPKPEDSKER